jgi:3-hydroxybutyryl-CoA dehydrogenase
MSYEIKSVSIIGAGTMGNQIAIRAALFDYNVRIFDVNPETLIKSEKVISREIKKKKGKEALNRISFHNKLEDAISDADLIIEAIPENLELKKNLFTELDRIAPEHTIIATNSSSIPVSKLEGGVQRKDKVLNIHFYLPIAQIPMADIMKGTQTSEDTFIKGKKWLVSIDCIPLVVMKECLGFVFNRVWRVIKKECLKIWAGGFATIDDVDKAWKTWSKMSMGPFFMMDAVGLDVIYDIEMSYYRESGDPNDKPPEKLKEMIDRGELGLKSGKGFYKWK